MNVIEEAKRKNAELVTASGFRVTTYTASANHETHKIHGCVHAPEGDVLVSWTLKGETTSYNSYRLEPYNILHHFKWSELPGWANLCIFKFRGNWFCSSTKPEWSIQEKRFVLQYGGISYVLPEVVTKYILVEVEDKDSLFLNPKYDGEEI